MMAHHPPLSPKREKQLISQARRGDRGALGELLGAYHRQIYHVCLRMVSHPEDAADVAQDTLAKAIEHIDSFEGKSKLSTWLFRIAMNLSISHLRKRKVRRAASLETAGDNGFDDQASSLKSMMIDEREPGPDHRVETDEQVDRLHEAIGGLDEDLRAVILLRDLQDMDYQQIAEVMGIPVGTVKSRLFRARLALRQKLSKTANASAETNKEP
jgi:RNA polymerase sigma-70 factor (ECF subfamily)